MRRELVAAGLCAELPGSFPEAVVLLLAFKSRPPNTSMDRPPSMFHACFALLGRDTMTRARLSQKSRRNCPHLLPFPHVHHVRFVLLSLRSPTAASRRLFAASTTSIDSQTTDLFEIANPASMTLLFLTNHTDIMVACWMPCWHSSESCLSLASCMLRGFGPHQVVWDGCGLASVKEHFCSWQAFVSFEGGPVFRSSFLVIYTLFASHSSMAFLAYEKA